jgi:sortase A
VSGLETLRGTAVSEAPAHGAAVSEAPAEEQLAAVDQSLWSEKRSAAFAEAMAHPGAPVGALSIPSIRLEVPVYSGTSELNLNRGAAHIEGTSPLGADGNVGIAAHRDGFFRGLESLHMDADVLLEVDSRTVRYRVVDIRIVEPTEVHVLAPTDTPSITLVTCYPFYFIGNAPERYIVRAELVGSAGGLGVPATRQLSAR